MNFTREPIIETIITPKEGSKLLVRSSKAEGQEEYTIDAVEVVSFGQALFFRSQERPKSFLVPVSDYEVVEVKEARAVLKNAQFERNIKIGGGREREQRREPVREQEESSEEIVSDEAQTPEGATAEGQFERRQGGRRRHHNRRRRAHEEREDMRARTEEEKPAAQEGSEPAAAPLPTFSSLIPPPTTLISETMSRYKDILLPPPEEPKSEKKEEEQPPSEGDPNTLSRVAVESHSTFFSPLSDWTNFIS